MQLKTKRERFNNYDRFVLIRQITHMLPPIEKQYNNQLQQMNYFSEMGSYCLEKVGEIQFQTLFGLLLCAIFVLIVAWENLKRRKQVFVRNPIRQKIRDSIISENQKAKLKGKGKQEQKIQKIIHEQQKKQKRDISSEIINSKMQKNAGSDWKNSINIIIKTKGQKQEQEETLKDFTQINKVCQKIYENHKSKSEKAALAQIKQRKESTLKKQKEAEIKEKEKKVIQFNPPVGEDKKQKIEERPAKPNLLSKNTLQAPTLQKQSNKPNTEVNPGFNISISLSSKPIENPIKKEQPKPLFPNLNPLIKKEQAKPLFPNLNPPIKKEQTKPLFPNLNPLPQQSQTEKLQNKIKTNENKQKQNQKQEEKKKPVQDKPALKQQGKNAKQVEIQKEKKQMVVAPEPKKAKKLQILRIRKLDPNNIFSFDYLQALIKYGKTFSDILPKKQIMTNNLCGARSCLKQIWVFADSYISAIDPSNHQQCVTFSYRTWNCVVNKFIRNTNARQGFERMPPRDPSNQCFKNQLNSYILIFNIYRCMGYQSIWLGAVANTLALIDFIYKRQTPITEWTDLELLKLKFVGFQKNIQDKYISRIDYLTYFLIGLTSLDPLLTFQHIAQKIKGQSFACIEQMRELKYKWSYKQFWMIFQLMKNNKFDWYFKIPFWVNVYSLTTVQQTQFLKNGSYKQFGLAGNWIRKHLVTLRESFNKGQEAKILKKVVQKTNDYQFDGEEFIGMIISVGNFIDLKWNQIKINDWAQFKDKLSAFFYFWSRLQ